MRTMQERESQPLACDELPAASERRTAKRADLEVNVDFNSDTNFYAGFAEDISEGGLFIATVMLREVGSTITVNFTLPDGHTVHGVGRVRWLRDPIDDHTSPGMGVQFIGLSSEDFEAIREFVSLRSPMFYE